MKSQQKRTHVKKPKQRRRPEMDDKDTIIITGGSASEDTIVLDLGDYALDQTMVDGTGGIGTITIDPSWSISSNGATYTTSNYSWNTISSNTAKVSIDQSGIDIADGADLKVGGRSLKDFMDTMEKRLAILVPDPEKLEHFEALKKAYEHYKTLEALCELPKKEDENQ